MKVIIAGSRRITSYTLLEQAIAESGFEITEVIEGEEPNGVDKLAKIWAKANKIPHVPFEPAWDDLEAEPCFVKKNQYGKSYNALAGFNRNQDMVDYGEALIALRKDSSPGTTDVIDRAKKAGLLVYVKEVK